MKLIPMSDTQRRNLANNPWLRCAESEDDDDIFMPSNKDKRAASSEGKSGAPSKVKIDASSKAKSATTSKDDSM
jgi:hypothetical protein